MRVNNVYINRVVCLHWGGFSITLGSTEISSGKALASKPPFQCENGKDRIMIILRSWQVMLRDTSMPCSLRYHDPHPSLVVILLFFYSILGDDVKHRMNNTETHPLRINIKIRYTDRSLCALYTTPSCYDIGPHIFPKDSTEAGESYLVGVPLSSSRSERHQITKYLRSHGYIRAGRLVTG